MATVEVKHAIANTMDYGAVRIPYWQIESGQDGPRLLITCAQHGNEVQGAEVMRRFVPMAARGLKKGQISIAPFCNKPALWKRRPHISTTPERPYADDAGHNMNRTWPGKAEGNDTERLSAAIYAALGEKATHNIDIHCWERFTGATALPRKDRPMSMDMAKVCALPFSNPREVKPATPPAPTMTIGALFNDSGRASLTFELSGQYIIYEREVRWGLRAALNIVKFLGMMEGAIEPPERPTVWLDNAEQVKVTAPSNGLFARAAGLLTADAVEQGQVIGYLLSDDDLSTTEIKSPISGFLHSYDCSRASSDVSLASQHPYASQGDRLATVVRPK
ncbi:MAG: succinylglutamate desuccinylase/aspartoacylase family protein [Planctomycetes bacterium]|nr:succinylglutamate desuccinylase/aspartoacylase family protein [Planctomycetota bacterium]